MKTIHILDDIYHINFSLMIDCSNTEFINFIDKHHSKTEGYDRKKLEETLSCAKGCLYWDAKPYYYMWLKQFNWSIHDQGVLVHEINHFVDFVFDNAGIPIRVENTEVRAYYFEYIFNQCYKELKKYNYKAKPKRKKPAKKIARKPKRRVQYRNNNLDDD